MQEAILRRAPPSPRPRAPCAALGSRPSGAAGEPGGRTKGCSEGQGSTSGLVTWGWGGARRQREGSGGAGNPTPCSAPPRLQWLRGCWGAGRPARGGGQGWRWDGLVGTAQWPGNTAAPHGQRVSPELGAWRGSPAGLWQVRLAGGTNCPPPTSRGGGLAAPRCWGLSVGSGWGGLAALGGEGIPVAPDGLAGSPPRAPGRHLAGMLGRAQRCPWQGGEAKPGAAASPEGQQGSWGRKSSTAHEPPAYRLPRGCSGSQSGPPAGSWARGSREQPPGPCSMGRGGAWGCV